jgi:hypothetical protein
MLIFPLQNNTRVLSTDAFSETTYVTFPETTYVTFSETTYVTFSVLARLYFKYLTAEGINDPRFEKRDLACNSRYVRENGHIINIPHTQLTCTQFL